MPMTPYIRKSVKYDVPWMLDEEADNCFLCHSKFSLVSRKHHCRACGKVVCADCSRARLFVSGSSNPKRTCDQCLNKEVTKKDDITSVVYEDDTVSSGKITAPPRARGESSFGASSAVVKAPATTATTVRELSLAATAPKTNQVLESHFEEAMELNAELSQQVVRPDQRLTCY